MKNFIIFFYCLIFFTFSTASRANNNIVEGINITETTNDIITDNSNNNELTKATDLEKDENTTTNITNTENNGISSNSENSNSDISTNNNNINKNNNVNNNDADKTDDEAKNKILNEFKEKLLNEQELKREKEKNITLTDRDLENIKNKNDSKITLKEAIKEAMKPTEEEILMREKQKKIKEEEEKIKKEEERLKKEQEKLKKEEERIKKEEERIKKEEERAKKRQQSEEEKLKRKKEREKLERDKEKLEEDRINLENETNTIGKLKESILSIGNNLKNIHNIVGQTSEQIEGEIPSPVKKKKKVRSGILTKEFNITDTGVSEEFLYSQTYKDLINNRTKINKNEVNKEEDIPILNVAEKNIISFSTSDIPPEILSYKRSDENKHIPTVILTKDLQDIAKKAIIENNLSVLRGIIEQTKDPDFLVGKDNSLLSFAVEKGRYILVRYLLYSGASINRTDSKLNIPLHVAIDSHDEEIVKLLVNNGANIDAQNIYGETPLMLAILSNQDNVAIFLLENKADVNLKNFDGETALDLCNKNRKNRIKQYIKAIILEEQNDN